jgi:membrane-bound metal-dependent hydrolase YbcI (DUF457 family)
MKIRNHIIISVSLFYLLCNLLSKNLGFNLIVKIWDIMLIIFVLYLMDLDRLFRGKHRKLTHNIFFLLVLLIISLAFNTNLLKFFFIADIIFLNWCFDLMTGGVYFLYPFKRNLFLKCNMDVSLLIENLISTCFLVYLLYAIFSQDLSILF